jgi:two-component SAPR family response regulator
MNYIIADPDTQSSIELKNILDGYAHLDFQGSYTTLGAAENGSLEHTPDIAFIRLGKAELNAFRLAGEFRERSPRSKVIFISSQRETAVDAFEHEADGFLLIPFDKRAVGRLLRNIGIERTDMLPQKLSRKRTGG